MSFRAAASALALTLPTPSPILARRHGARAWRARMRPLTLRQPTISRSHVTSSTPQFSADAGEIVAHVYGLTDVGRTREHNEDTFLVADLASDAPAPRDRVHTFVLRDRGTLFMVADGLGGAAAGEVASAMAVETVFAHMRQHWSASTDASPERFAACLRSATEEANARIHAYAREHPDSRGMGTTATIAGLFRDTLYLVQVGDSRAYLVRDGKVQQITKDQSLMQRLIDAGELTEEEAERSERRNIILQALGPEPVIRADLTFQQIRHGDALLLCTDGLFGQVRKTEIEELLDSHSNLVSVCEELIARANESGGPDNITVVAARFAGRKLVLADARDKVGHEVYPLAGTDQSAYSSDHESAPVTGHTSTQAAVRRTAGQATRGNRTLRVVMIALVTLAVILGGIVLAMRIGRSRADAAPRPIPSPTGAGASTGARASLA